MICPNCKNKIKSTDDFCTKCGEPIDHSVEHLSIDETYERGYNRKLNRGEAEVFGHKVDTTVKETPNGKTYTQTIRYGGFFYLGPLMGLIMLALAYFVIIFISIALVLSPEVEIVSKVVAIVILIATFIGLFFPLRSVFTSFKDGVEEKKKYKQLVKDGIIQKEKFSFPKLLYRIIIILAFAFLLMFIFVIITSLSGIKIPDIVYSYCFGGIGISMAVCVVLYTITYAYYLFIKKIDLLPTDDKHK